MKQSSKCAIGGIVSALSLVLMISVAIIPFLTYALPAVAGLLIVFIVIEIDKKWAVGVYSAVGILAFLLVPDKEVAMMYIAFFGYYPIIKAVLENRLPTALCWIIKVVTFVVTMVAAYLFLIFVMGIAIDEIDEFGAVAVPMLLGAGCVAFVAYDIALTRIITVYLLKWRKYFKRYFK
ncbi:MAG: hypothetical protein IKB88_09865 [Clostridia bacterium]|nr:hypothetical protein [Clostridia bacterium]